MKALTISALSFIVLLLSGCFHDVNALSEEEIGRFAPDTIKRFRNLRDIPEEVAASVASDLGLRELQDRGINWTGGCSAGARLLEAGERKDGWWVFYQLGGIVDSKRLAMLARQNGQLKVVSTVTLR